MVKKLSISVKKGLRELAGIINGCILRLNPKSREIISNRIVFICNTGKGYGCNPKYIAEELLRRNLDLDLIWLVNERDPSIPVQIEQRKIYSIQGAYALLTARVWVDNCRTRRHVKKKEGQYYIQTWHASYGPKRIEAEAMDDLSRTYIRGAKRDGKEIDLMFANNAMHERVFKEAFWYKGPVMRFGVPRNAPIIRDSEAARSKVYQELSLDADKRICLYAPTFRNDLSLDVYRFDYEKCRIALEKRFGGSFVFALRMHPNLTDKSGELIDSRNANIIDLSKYPDAQELSAAVDVMISDYSSMLDEYAMTNNPGYIYAPDAERYSKERGFCYSIYERPYPVATTEEELLQLIEETTDSEFEAKRNAFFDMIRLDDDGNGDKDVADIIERVIGSSES